MSLASRFSRRSFLNMSLCCLGGAIIMPGLIQAAEQAPKKPLVVYFTHSGNTEKIAQDIHKHVGGDILRIEQAHDYPEKYHDLTEAAKKEQERNARPELKTPIPDLSEYGVIFLGYPNWWSSMPMPVYTFVEKSGLDGKTIAPFATHGGGGLGHSVEDLKKLVPHSKVLKPLAVSGNFASRAEKDVEKWLEGLGPALIMTTTGNPAIYPDGGY